jgi:hypothetical protein
VEHVILIHDIQYQDEEPDVGTSFLLVTKFSFLAATYPFNLDCSHADRNRTTRDKELLLHFEDFNNMGLPADAEVIKIEDIVHAECLTDNEDQSLNVVDPVVQPPQGRSDSQ